MNKLSAIILSIIVFIALVWTIFYLNGRIDDLKQEMRLKDNIIAFNQAQQQKIYEDLELFLSETTANKKSYEEYQARKKELKQDEEIKSFLNTPVVFDINSLL